MAKKAKSYIDEFIALPDEEKEHIVSEFDREFIADTFGPLTPAARARWEKASRRMKAERRGSRKKVTVTQDEKLVHRSDKLAKKQGVSRSQLIARGLEALARAD